MKSSPATPIGTGWPRPSSTNTTVLAIGFPIGTDRTSAGNGASIRCVQLNVVASVGP